MFRPRKQSRSSQIVTNQSGAALIMVLLLVAVMLILSVSLVDGVRYNSQRLLNQRFMEQSFWYALGGETLAKYALEDIADEETVNLGQDWAREDILFPIDGGSIAGRFVDQQACFNLNNLYPPNTEDGEEEDPDRAPLRLFRNLFTNLELSQQRADFIAGRVADWIDEDFSPEGVYGAEDLNYNRGDYPFMPPNALLTSLSELTLFAEFEEGEQGKLWPNFCVLPQVDTTLNINTLKVEQAALLAAALDNLITVDQARMMLESRPAQGWPDVESFVASLGLSEETPLSAEMQNALGVKSNYFMGLADVFYQQRQLKVYSRFVIKGTKVYAYSREYGDVF
ncbi:type II secretion system minor pseudopilin GspK [Spongiibacter sp. KMU-158]|uniref:Type II secretion system protein K n=1 Tax=Spongiibacter pelagi TaxID=2760804 RepID=A0A927BZN9_9GAMM|nr:type II secretion system minor pseudopilin GspK [Spongiibacter pelagi]MBD2858553.1 type II secretion system minor pseudopilin GspK [Spongiibacter pelagi]